MACFCFNDSGEDLVGETIFLNVLVENGSEGIETIVRESVSKSMGRGLISARIAKRAGQLASVALSDSRIGEKMSQRITDALPSRLEEVGITAEISREFMKGPFFVIKLVIMNVDMGTLIAVRTGEDDTICSCFFSSLEKIMVSVGAKDDYDHSMNTFIAGKLQIILPERLGSVLESKGMTSAIAVKTKEEQPDYFREITSNDAFRNASALSSAETKTTGVASRSNPDTPMKEGFLHKLSPTFGVGLQSRYFVLRNTAPKTVELMYFESKDDYIGCNGNLANLANTKKGSILCGEIQNIVINSNVKPNKTQILITMDSTSSKRVEYELYSGSESDATEWVAAIRKAIKDHR